jgi:exodeoxyribonuclease VII large subunit
METDIKSTTKIYSVDEITTYIKNLIEKNRTLQNIWVKGEISNFRHPNKTHMYFSLKDENSIIDCAMFQRANQNLEFIPEDGMKLLVKGNLDVYKLRGTYQIIVEEMHLTGKGELYLKFLQLKAKLEKEGIFKEEYKKSIPKYPKTVGVVTSPEGSVIHDIIKVIKRRYPQIKLLIFPSLVQGDEAKYTIVKGIEILNQLCVDVIIIARGGGSFEDLWSFNEEIVAKAIFKSKVPIITGIGHETDFTIADFVADKRAPTPSVAAELVVPNKAEIFNNLANLENGLYKYIITIIESYKQQICYILNRPLFKRPFSLIEEYKQHLDEKGIQLKQIATNKIEILKINLKGFGGKLNALSPYSILERGYSITMKEGKTISSTKNINLGDAISIIVKDGEINSKVNGKNERTII